MKLKTYLPLLIVLLGGCFSVNQPHDGQGQYRIATIGNSQRSIPAVVISAKKVTIKELNSGAYAEAGGWLGGAIAAEDSDNSAVIIAGIIAGAVVGNAIEDAKNTYAGTEYIIQAESGRLFTVAQVDSNADILKKGDKALLVYGYPHRLMKDPR
jgi:outer membrane lipoprotein SlyB|tara:strand:- start:418 stop:879 length:462 start_codon:yes stop_codon:yes gene_type:complete